jgi:Cu+-exporting ATPase
MALLAADYRALPEPALATADAACCFHCGTPCAGHAPRRDTKRFCCTGCATVFDLLTSGGLDNYYRMADGAGVRIRSTGNAGRFRFVDEPGVRERLVDFTDGRATRVTLYIPAIHCIACVWLLENLFRLQGGIGQSEVTFPRKEVAITFENDRTKLSTIIALLASLGYEPELKLSDLQRPGSRNEARRLWLRLGVAGFAFGNIMLFSIASYFGLDSFSGPAFKKLVGFISLLLAVPVLLYSASDYWRAAWVSLRERMLAIEVPIAAGLVAIFAQSSYEVLSSKGEGYFDSFAALLFFLLIGRVFQQKTYARLAFDRDYTAFFPLSITRKESEGESLVSLSQLRIGDRVVLRNAELIPADAKLIDGPALIDYSFITGEAEPVAKNAGDYLYAGGRHMGGRVELELIKPVSQSYLTSLWNQHRKSSRETLDNLTNRYSRRFTKLVIAVAAGAAVYWAFVDPSVSIKAFTSVLIVACPCALALAAPFTLGTAIRALGQRRVYVKGPHTIELLASVTSIVFDKTGTLTAAGGGAVTFAGQPLTGVECVALTSVARQSTHPYAVRIAQWLNADAVSVRSFAETAGCGMEGIACGHEIALGSVAWIESRGWSAGENAAARNTASSVVHVVIDGIYRGHFVLASAIRGKIGPLISELAGDYNMAVLSGDNDKDRASLRRIFGPAAELRFNQTPLDKLNFITTLQRQGETVMMAGDGLNDAVALKQSDVGVAVVENIGAFSPASDVIMDAEMLPGLHRVLRFARDSVRVVRLSFLVSSLYNVVGIAIAARGLLSPIVCAVLMPVSSITIVLFASGLTTWAARRLKREESL